MTTQVRPITFPSTSAPVLISSTQSVRMSLLREQSPLDQAATELAPKGERVLILPGPTPEDSTLTHRVLRGLEPAIFGPSSDIYILQWARLWDRQSNERFGPLIRDVAHCTNAPTFAPAPFHLVCIGTGALLALKWLSDETDPSLKPNLKSITMVEPSLTIQGRRPRINAAGLPEAVALIHDCHSDSSNSHANMRDILRRLAPRAVTLYALEHPTLFRSATGNFQGMANFNSVAHDFAGSWVQSWADWLAACTPPNSQMSVTDVWREKDCA